jgi:hypothetical protein
MTRISTLSTEAPVTHAPLLACRLNRKEVLRRGVPAPFYAEAELENVSDTLLEIAYQMTVLHHLNLIVHDANGNVVSQGHFGDRFAPTEKPRFLRLAPGEKFAAEVHLFATAPQSMRTPGTYSIQAVYECAGLRAMSEPIEVTVSQAIE